MQNIPAKKSLGQNFLKSKVALTKMIEAGEVSENDVVLEVGPGKGVLTEKLLGVAKKVIAVEKDDRLISFLQDKFSTEISTGRLEIIHDDILNLELPRLNLRSEERFILGNSYKIIANIPYYITGLFLRKFLEETDNQPEKIVVMVQKEIAQRVVASKQAGQKESLLSMSIKAYGIPKMVMKVDRENFSPAPNVDSAILLIADISKKFFTDNKITEEKFFEILHAGFAHKRKILLGNLKEWLKKEGGETKNLGQIFSQSNLSEKIRAEDLTLNQWSDLVKNLS
jgi:16S rRNA (adenine1518-N6/adenine1519-N6)-dimethyltransferase